MNDSPLKRILYVEDEQDIRYIAQMALTKTGGFELQMAESGQQALDSLSRFQPDLVLIDVMMPEMDGPQTIEAIRKESGFEKIPFIYMTAKVRQEEIEKYLETGALGVIHKPFNPMTLASEIQTIWQSC